MTMSQAGGSGEEKETMREMDAHVIAQRARVAQAEAAFKARHVLVAKAIQRWQISDVKLVDVIPHDPEGVVLKHEAGVVDYKKLALSVDAVEMVLSERRAMEGKEVPISTVAALDPVRRLRVMSDYDLLPPPDLEIPGVVEKIGGDGAGVRWRMEYRRLGLTLIYGTPVSNPTMEWLNLQSGIYKDLFETIIAFGKFIQQLIYVEEMGGPDKVTYNAERQMNRYYRGLANASQSYRSEVEGLARDELESHTGRDDTHTRAREPRRTLHRQTRKLLQYAVDLGMEFNTVAFEGDKIAQKAMKMQPGAANVEELEPELKRQKRIEKLVPEGGRPIFDGIG